MTEKDDLFLLINSLNRMERGYFSKYADIHAKGGENTYKRLFHLICTTENPSAELIRENFKGENLEMHVSTAKNQLFHIILRTMRSYGSEGSHFARANDLIRDTDLLNYRNLKSASKKALERARNYAEENELLISQLEILRRELQTLSRYPQQCTLEMYQNLRKRYYATSQKIQMMFELECAFIKIGMMRSRFTLVRHEKERKELQQLIAELPAIDERQSCTEAKTLYHLIMALTHKMQSDFLSAHYHFHRSLDLFHHKKDYSSMFPDNYLIVISGYIKTAIMLGKNKEAMHGLAILKRLHNQHPIFRSDKLKTELFFALSNYELMYFIENSEYKKAKEQVNFLVIELPGFENQLSASQRLELYIRMSVASLLNNDTRKALHFLNRVYSEKFEHQHREFSGFCRVYYLLLHAEIGNKDHLYYAIRSIQRKLERENNFGDAEKLLMKYFRSQVLKGKRNSREFQIEKFISELFWLKSDPLFHYFDFYQWFCLKQGITPHHKERNYKNRFNALSSTAIPVAAEARKE